MKLIIKWRRRLLEKKFDRAYYRELHYRVLGLKHTQGTAIRREYEKEADRWLAIMNEYEHLLEDLAK